MNLLVCLLIYRIQEFTRVDWGSSFGSWIVVSMYDCLCVYSFIEFKNLPELIGRVVCGFRL